MRSRLVPPRCGSMLSSRCSLKSTVLAGTTSVYLYLAQQDPRTMVLDNRTRSVGLKEDLIL